MNLFTNELIHFSINNEIIKHGPAWGTCVFPTGWERLVGVGVRCCVENGYSQGHFEGLPRGLWIQAPKAFAPVSLTLSWKGMTGAKTVWVDYQETKRLWHCFSGVQCQNKQYFAVNTAVSKYYQERHVKNLSYCTILQVPKQRERSKQNKVNYSQRALKSVL